MNNRPEASLKLAVKYINDLEDRWKYCFVSSTAVAYEDKNKWTFTLRSNPKRSSLTEPIRKWYDIIILIEIFDTHLKNGVVHERLIC